MASALSQFRKVGATRLRFAGAVFAIGVITAYGGLSQGALPDRTLNALRTQVREHIDSSCGGLKQGLEGRVRVYIQPLQAKLKERVPQFGDWLFGWSVSYDRDRMLLGAGFSTAFDRAVAGDFGNLWPAVEDTLSEKIRESFRVTVVDPVDVDGKAEVAWRSVIADIDADWRRILDERDAIIVSALRSSSLNPEDVAGSIDLLAAKGAIKKQEPRPSGAEGGILIASVEPDEEVLTRAPRPIVARLAGFALRRSAGLSTFGIARLVSDNGELGLIAFIPGVVLGYGAAVLTAMGLDYLITKTDETVNRVEVESSLEQAIDRSFDVVSSVWTKQLADHVDRQCKAARPI